MGSTAHLTGAHRRELEKALEHYPQDDWESRLLRDLPVRFQAARCIERKEDFLEIVRWKAPRQTGHASENRPEKLRRASAQAFALASEDRVVEAIKSLRAPALSGVGTRVATAILMFYEPNRFTVLDKLAWRSLVHLGVLDAFDCWFEEPEDYPPYLGACTRLAKWFQHTLRDTDRALWQLAEDNGRSD